MEKYLGVKLIQAEPMNLGDYNLKRGWQIPNDEYPSTEGYNVIYTDSYESWSPKDVFEEAYRHIDNLTFGLAIEAMKKGMKVARSGWNGKGMWIALQEPYPDTDCDLPYIYIKTADNHVVPWLASQTDMLAEDWVIVD